MSERLSLRAAPLALCACALVGCPRGVTPSPTDGSTSDASSDASDSTSEFSVGFTVSLRVVQGPFVPESPARDFAVLAQARDGTRIERVTDDEGRVQLALDPSLAPWDVTVAKAGFLAVSIMDVREAMDTVVYTQRLVDRRESLRPRMVSARFRNAADTSVASLVSRSLVSSEFASEPAWELDQLDDARPTIGPQRFWAIEWRSDGSGFPLRPLRAVRLDEVSPERAGPIAFDVDFSTATVMPAESVVQVVLPTTGLVQRDTVRLGNPTRVQFANVPELGARYASYAVGSVSAEHVRATQGPTITIAHLASELTPVTGSVTYPNAEGAAPFELQLWPTVSGGPSSLVIAPVDALSITGTSISTTRFEARAEGYHPGFAVLGADGQSVGWIGYSQGARAIATRALPSLPSGFDLAAQLGADNGRVIATLTHRSSSARPPWEPGELQSLDAEVDSAFVAVTTR